MNLKILPFDFTVCKIKDIRTIDWEGEFLFIGKTDEEISLVCKTCDAPADAVKREDGWKGFRIEGELDFSLIGILSKISTLLAENQIGIFAVSTYNTDYILVKKEHFENACRVLDKAGYKGAKP